MCGTPRALQMDWTAFAEELCEGPKMAATPRESWSQARGGIKKELVSSAEHGLLFMQTMCVYRKPLVLHYVVKYIALEDIAGLYCIHSGCTDTDTTIATNTGVEYCTCACMLVNHIPQETCPLSFEMNVLLWDWTTKLHRLQWLKNVFCHWIQFDVNWWIGQTLWDTYYSYYFFKFGGPF